MIPGDAVAGTGLAGYIAEEMAAEYGEAFNVVAASKSLNAIAKAVVRYITDEAVVTVVIDETAHVGGVS